MSRRDQQLPGRPTLPQRVVHAVRRDGPLALLDIAIIFAAYFIPLVFRFSGSPAVSRFWLSFRLFVLLAMVIHISAGFFFGLYGQMWKFASVEEARRIVVSVAVAVPILAVLNGRGEGQMVPISVLLMGGTLTLMGLGAIRFQSRLFGYRRRAAEGSSSRRVLIMGAGAAGAMILADIHRNPGVGMEPVGLLDDDRRKFGGVIRGVSVLGSRASIPALARKLRIDEVLLAIPSADRHMVQDISALCEEAGVALRTLPSREEIVAGKVSVRDIRDLSIEDLLGRQQVETDYAVVEQMLKGRRVLVTGAGGSIGSEIARQVAAFGPAELLLLDHDETHLHDLSLDLGETPYARTEVVYLLADIRNVDAMTHAFLKTRPHVVFHAAAHKHVPILESFPEEAFSTNVVGTQNLVRCAVEAGVERFVMISTDKAINTTNVMGASKWFAEQVVRGYGEGATNFSSVRFGNVLGSRGSVVPTFLRQIQQGGPVTVTDAAMARYFMTVREAVQLVLQAGALAEGGEVFTLEMGEPVKIMELAQRLIRLSGRIPGVDIAIEITGPRPGEKLVEEVVDACDDQLPDPFPGIKASLPPKPDLADLERAMRTLEALADTMDRDGLARHLKRFATSPSIGDAISTFAVSDIVDATPR